MPSPALDDLSHVLNLASALVDGGVAVMEFPLTNPEAVDAIARLRTKLQRDALIGAGSVLTPEQANAVIDAGAQFVVSPNTSLAVIDTCLNRGVPPIPGAMTPTEIMTAVQLGAPAVKVFPARGLGPAYIKDVLAPMPDLRLVPTGGINADNAQAFLRAGAFALGVGGALVDSQTVANRDWIALAGRARRLRQAVQD